MVENLELDESSDWRIGNFSNSCAFRLLIIEYAFLGFVTYLFLCLRNFLMFLVLSLVLI